MKISLQNLSLGPRLSYTLINDCISKCIHSSRELYPLSSLHSLNPSAFSANDEKINTLTSKDYRDCFNNNSECSSNDIGENDKALILLDISYNQIENLNDMRLMTPWPQLKEIYLSNNLLTGKIDMSLPLFLSARIIDLSCNDIMELQNLHILSKTIEVLILDKNPIKRLTDIYPIAMFNTCPLNSLKTLSLQYCDVLLEQTIQSDLILLCPLNNTLKFLNLTIQTHEDYLNNLMILSQSILPNVTLNINKNFNYSIDRENNTSHLSLPVMQSEAVTAQRSALQLLSNSSDNIDNSGVSQDGDQITRDADYLFSKVLGFPQNSELAGLVGDAKFQATSFDNLKKSSETALPKENFLDFDSLDLVYLTKVISEINKEATTCNTIKGDSDSIDSKNLKNNFDESTTFPQRLSFGNNNVIKEKEKILQKKAQFLDRQVISSKVNVIGMDYNETENINMYDQIGFLPNMKNSRYVVTKSVPIIDKAIGVKENYNHKNIYEEVFNQSL